MDKLVIAMYRLRPIQLRRTGGETFLETQGLPLEQWRSEGGAAGADRTGWHP